MMLSLRTRQEKAAARIESDRLRGLSPADLAAEIMPVFAPERTPVGNLEAVKIGYWLMRSHARPYRETPRLRMPVTRALHVLADADLIENKRRGVKLGARLAVLHATPRGLTALKEGTVRRDLS
jgi:hypothetical protein